MPINWTNTGEGHGPFTVAGVLLAYLHERGCPARWCEQVGQTMDEEQVDELIRLHLIYPMEMGALHRAGPNPNDLPELLRRAASVLQRLEQAHMATLQEEALMQDVRTMLTTLETTADQVEAAMHTSED